MDYFGLSRQQVEIIIGEMAIDRIKFQKNIFSKCFAVEGQYIIALCREANSSGDFWILGQFQIFRRLKIEQVFVQQLFVFLETLC